MSDKYIIKNCPCYSSKYEYCLGRATKYCKDAIYCPIKQIVESCKGTEKYYSECIEKNRETFGQYMDEENMTWLMGRSHHSLEILRLLDIQDIK